MTGPVAVILAGGGARRMGGGDKGLLQLGRGTVLDQVIARVSPQVADLALNANGDAARFGHLGLDVVADAGGGDDGPLAGILAAMIWAKGRGAAQVVTVPGDTPFLPGDLVPYLMLAANDSGMSVAESGGRLHPLCGLWPVALADDLRAAIAGDLRRVRDWTGRHDPGIARFPLTDPDGFFNVNTPEDLAQAQAWVGP